MDRNEYLNGKIGIGTRLAYGGANFGGNLIYATVSSFATYYYTDNVGIAAAVVGTMMLLARFVDGVSDIVMGGIIDKTHTKWGQAKPWFVASILPLVASLILIFSVPDSLSYNGKIIYMYVTYIFSAVICYTANSLSAVAMQSLMTGNIKERMGLNAFYQMFGFVSVVGINMVTSNIAGKIGWQKLTWSYALLSTVLLVATAITCKEKKHKYIGADTETEQQKTSFKTALPVLLRSRYFYIILVLAICNYISIGTFNAGGVYYAQYILGNPGLFGIMTLSSMFPAVIFTNFVPKIAMKIGQKNMILVGYLLQTAGYILVSLANTKLPVLLVGQVFTGLGTASVSGLLIPVIGEVIRYYEMTKGMHLDGVMNSVSTLGLKIGTGLGAAFVGWILAFGGYQSGEAVQTASAVLAMRTLVGFIPLGCAVIGGLVVLALNIEKKLQQITE